MGRFPTVCQKLTAKNLQRPKLEIKTIYQKEQKVYYNEPMPPDFTRSEKVVVIGNYQNNDFVARKILLKCPSKYQEEKINASI